MPDVPRKFKKDNIQSVRFSRSHWKPMQASKWLRDHGFHNTKEFDPTVSELRYRQFNPLKTRKYRYHAITPHIKFVLEY